MAKTIKTNFPGTDYTSIEFLTDIRRLEVSCKDKDGDVLFEMDETTSSSGDSLCRYLNQEQVKALIVHLQAQIVYPKNPDPQNGCRGIVNTNMYAGILKGAPVTMVNNIPSPLNLVYVYFSNDDTKGMMIDINDVDWEPNKNPTVKDIENSIKAEIKNNTK